MNYIYFHRRWLLGAPIMVPWGLQRRQAFFGFQTLSRPLLVDFIPLNILLKHQNSSIASTCLVVPVFGQASFSALLSNSSLSWVGKEERKDTSPLAYPHLFGALKRQPLGAQHEPSGWGSHTSVTPPSKPALEITSHSPVFANQEKKHASGTLR